ncbi:MAG: hypothetical protein ACYS80_06790 [Planctomycetota bacterium]|jgi:predicted outer membrane repeat protein
MKAGANLKICLFLIISLLAMASPAMGKIIFTDADAVGNNDGSSWVDAYNFLQDALADANSAEKPVEIWVAQGIYKPDQGGSNMPGDREATFQLINDVTLKGGFAGLGESDPNAREIYLYETILSGDLNDNDVDVNDPSELHREYTRNENSYHVVTSSGTNKTAVLEGFTIIGSNANGGYPHSYGGGMYNVGSRTTVLNCTFINNSAKNKGGGMHNTLSSPTLANCTFRCNLASGLGGGLSSSDDSHPKLSNCTFITNITLSGSGGGVFNSRGSLTLDNCSFMSNSAKRVGGGIRSAYGSDSTTLSNCTFIANTADLYGGGFSDSSKDSILINCTFEENSAEYGGAIEHGSKNLTIERCTFRKNWATEGGAIYKEGIDLTIERCIFKTNWAIDGGAIFNMGHQGSSIMNCCIFNGNSADNGGAIENWDNPNTILTNCVFSGNSANLQGGALYNYQSRPFLTNCTFAGNSAQDGNALACEPKFWSNVELINCILWDGGNEIWNNDVSKITVNYSNVQGGWPGEANIDTDPLFVDPNNDDYHLLSERGRYWQEHDVWVLDEVTSPCIDSGDPAADPSGEPTPNGGRINMGAYGGTAYASMSEILWFDPDINGDGVVDILDIVELIEKWLEAAGWTE